MKLAWVTAAFLGAREDRPASYYLQPLVQTVRRLKGSPFTPIVWTWERSLRDVQSIVPAEWIRLGDPRQLCLRASSDYRWRLLGRELHACPSDMMCRYTDMLAVYMSRVGLIEQTFMVADVDACLWFDCGWVNSVLGRCDARVFEAWRLQTAAETLRQLLERYGLVLCRIPGLKEAIVSHAATWSVASPCYATGGIWACRKDAIAGFADQVELGWRTLLASGCLQDDECAMTLAMWFRAIPSLHQDAWYCLICGTGGEPAIRPWLEPAK